MGISASEFKALQASGAMDAFTQPTEEPPAAKETPAYTGVGGESGKTGLGGFVHSVAENVKDLESSAIVGARNAVDFVTKKIPVGMLESMKGNPGVQFPFNQGMPDPATPVGNVIAHIFAPIPLPKNIEERADKPKTIAGKFLGPMAESIGGMVVGPISKEAEAIKAGARLYQATRNFGAVSQPIKAVLSSIDYGRTVVSGAGIGLGQEVGAKTLERILGYYNDDWADWGHTIGGVAGGALGAHGNVIRFNAMGEMAKHALQAPIETAKAFSPAYSAAKIRQADLAAQGKKVGFHTIMFDEMGKLRAATQGYMKQKVYSDIASALRGDRQALENIQQFEETINKTGADPNSFNLAARTGNAEITALSENIPETFTGERGREARGTITSAAVSRKKEVARAVGAVVKNMLPYTGEGGAVSARAYQGIVQAQIEALGSEAAAAINKYPAGLSPVIEKTGVATKDLRDKEYSYWQESAKRDYQLPLDAADAAQVAIVPSKLLSQTGAMSEELAVAIGAEEVPSAAKKFRFLNISEEEQRTSRATADVASTEDIPSKTWSLREMNAVWKALNKKAGQLRGNDYRQPDYYRVLQLKDALKSDIDSALETHPEIAQAFDTARSNYAKNAPRFREGLGRGLSTEEGGTFAGRAAITGAEVRDVVMGNPKLLSTTLAEWDNLYRKTPESEKMLQAMFASVFKDKIFPNRVNLSPTQLENARLSFMQDYAPLVERYPQLADHMEQTMAKVMENKLQQESLVKHYKELTNSDTVSAKVGVMNAKVFVRDIMANPDNAVKYAAKISPDNAKTFIKEIMELSDPRIEGGTKYDSGKLLSLVEGSKLNIGQKSSLQIIAEKAYGQEKGVEFIAKLKALGDLAEREANARPGNMQPNQIVDQSPVQHATGQSAAQITSVARSMGMNFMSGPYALALGLSRLAQVKTQAVMGEALFSALHTPEGADAVLKLALSNDVKDVPKGVFDKLFGSMRVDGVKLVDKILDRSEARDYSGEYQLRGAIIGGAMGAGEKEKNPTFRSTSIQEKPTGIDYTPEEKKAQDDEIRRRIEKRRRRTAEQ